MTGDYVGLRSRPTDTWTAWDPVFATRRIRACARSGSPSPPASVPGPARRRPARRPARARPPTHGRARCWEPPWGPRRGGAPAQARRPAAPVLRRAARHRARALDPARPGRPGYARAARTPARRAGAAFLSPRQRLGRGDRDGRRPNSCGAAAVTRSIAPVISAAAGIAIRTTSCSTSVAIRGRPARRRAEPSYLRAISSRYQRRIVSGVTRPASRRSSMSIVAGSGRGRGLASDDGGSWYSLRSSSSSLSASTAAQLSIPGALGDVARRAGADRERRGDLAMASTLLPLQSQNLSGLAHEQSLRRHGTPLGAPGKPPSSSRRRLALT
jgi:hypothetical protein